nr:deoxycytidylate deaminase-like [Manis javanica]
MELLPSEPDTEYRCGYHAELNTILSKNVADMKGCLGYVTSLPRNECANLLIWAGIKEVRIHGGGEPIAMRLIFDMAGVTFGAGTLECGKVFIDFDPADSRPGQKLQSVPSH